MELHARPAIRDRSAHAGGKSQRSATGNHALQRTEECGIVFALHARRKHPAPACLPFSDERSNRRRDPDFQNRDAGLPEILECVRQPRRGLLEGWTKRSSDRELPEIGGTQSSKPERNRRAEENSREIREKISALQIFTGSAQRTTDLAVRSARIFTLP